MGISLLDTKNARGYISFLKEAKIPFTLTCSNYSTSIKAPDMVDKKFVAAMMSGRCFAAFSKIKADVKKIAAPEIDSSELVYFVHDLKRSFASDEIMNIDLKSAYATILYLDKIISSDTFEYLKTITKSDRLASVGMLASKKTDFFFDKQGVITDVVERKSEHENFFFYAVKRTFEIMTDLRGIIADKYLFTWVDGIYFSKDDSVMMECAEYLDSIRFDFSFEILNNFNIDYSDKGIRIEFLKEGYKKTFSLPPRLTEFNRIIADAIMQFNNVKKIKNETSKSKISRQ